MPLFVKKQGPIFRLGRLAHLLVGASITVSCSNEWGLTGSVIGGFGAITLGLGWEIWNKISSRGWHPYGDAIDFWSFVIGATIGGSGYAIFY